MIGDLTTLANVKAWLGIQGTTSDATLQRLISATSALIRTACDRPSFLSQSYVERRNGTGNSSMVLRYFPVTEVSLVSVGGSIIPPGVYNPATQSQPAGYYLSGGSNSPDLAQTLRLVNYYYALGNQNVTVEYVAGFKDTELFDIPASPYLYTVVGQEGPWAGPAGLGVYDPDTLVPYTLVAGSPAEGQFAYGATPGTYQFNAADAGNSLAVDYSYTPWDLEQICIEWVSEKFTKRNYIGIKGKTLGGQETISFDNSGIPPYIASQLARWTSVLIIT